MNVSNLIELTLINLNEDTDELTKQEYRSQLLEFLNQAYMDIMRRRYPVFKYEEAVIPESGIFSTDDLDLSCVCVERVTRNGRATEWSCTGNELLTASGNVKIKYRYLPPLLNLDTDTPVFPEDVHYALTDYAAYRVLMTGSRARQARGEAFYNSYLTAVVKLEQRHSDRIRNKY